MVRHCGLEVKKWLFKCLVIFSTLVVCYNWGIGFLKVEAASCSMSSGCSCGGSKVSPLAWNQSACGSDVNTNWANFVQGTSSQTISFSGCFAMSLATQMGMSGDFNNFCPLSLFNWGKSNGLWANGCELCPTVVANIPEYKNVFRALGVDKTIIESIPDVKFRRDEKIGDEGGGYTKKEMYELAVKLAEAGVYVILEVDYTKDGWTMCHFVPVIGIVNADNALGKELVIVDGATDADDSNGARFRYDDADASKESSSGLDVARRHKRDMENVPYSSSYLVSLRVFISASKFSGKVNATNNSSLAEKQQQSLFNYVSIANMLEEEYFVDIKQLEERALALPTYSDLLALVGYESVGELYDWEETISIQKADRVHHYVRAGVMFFGILITVYSILLFIAFQFDKVNNFVDLNALGMLSFNRFSVSPDERSTFGETSTKDGSKTKYLTFKNIVFVTCIGIALGIFLISGKAYSLVSTAINLVSDLFHDSNRLS